MLMDLDWTKCRSFSHKVVVGREYHTAVNQHVRYARNVSNLESFDIAISDDIWFEI
jgi:hypothetical protein